MERISRSAAGTEAHAAVAVRGGGHSEVQTRTQAVSRPLLLAILFLIACAGLRAQQLPIRTYTTSDGLPRNGINRIVRDSHGFLWFCTVEGLSRFDGYTFTNYGVEQGVPDRMVTDLIETRSGDYWIATFNGIARFNPSSVPPNAARETKADKRRPAPRFVHYPTDWHPGARSVVALLEDRDGTIWFTTDGGLGHLQKVGGEWQIRAVDLGPQVTDVGPRADGRRSDGDALRPEAAYMLACCTQEENAVYQCQALSPFGDEVR